MSDSSPEHMPARNSLYSLASVGGVLLGAFLLAGAYGHFEAVWPIVGGDREPERRVALMLPGAVLLFTGLLNIGLCRALWIGAGWSLQLALAGNSLTAIYLGLLLYRSVVPDHPIGVFLALVSSFVLILAAIRVGLTWPATGTDSA